LAEVTALDRAPTAPPRPAALAQNRSLAIFCPIARESISRPPLDELARVYERHNPRCIGCGDDNDLSLGFRIDLGPDSMTGRVCFNAAHEGGLGLVHGGMLGVALDEALGRAACLRRRAHCVTARLELDFRAPATIGEYEIAIHEESHDGRKTWMSGQVVRGEEVYASARGLFIAVAPALGDA